MAFQVLIIGCGPAGASASIHLSNNKIPHTIVDKAIFPRDKICGDALSGKVVHALNKLNPDFVKEIRSDKLFTGSYGVSFFGPNGKRLDVPFSTDETNLKHAPGFLARRMDFDNFLFSKLKTEHTDIRENTAVTSLQRTANGIHVKFQNAETISEGTYSIVISGEGDRSIVRKTFTDIKKEDDHYCAGIRAYYSGVKNMHPKNFIELHFIKELLPGYLWIFPMHDGTANVGIGMLSSVVSKKKINLKQTLLRLLSEHELLKSRFETAQPIDKIQGWGLPLGSKKRILSGERFILIGDAGSLIDPFTGEGIGNAMLSGIAAAETALEAIDAKNFSSAFLKQYDNTIYRSLGDELELSHKLQKMARFSGLFNFIVNKANKSKTLSETITCMFEDVDLRQRLRSPAFYLRLLLNK